MVTNTSTPPPNTNLAASATTQSAQSSTQQLSDSAMDPAVKTALLQLYLRRIVVENERANILTGVSVVNAETDQSLFGHNLDQEHFAASVNKIPIAALVLNDLRSGELQFNQMLSWTVSDIRGGGGVFDQPNAPMSATVEDLLFDMLNPSGNTAVRVFVNHAFGGAAAVNQRFQQELGLEHTYLQPLQGTSFYVGNTTAREAMANMRTLVSVDDNYTEFVKNALTTNPFGDYGVRSQLAGNDFIVLSNKVGILDDPEGNNRHDVGIIYNTKTGKSYGYAFLNTAFGENYNLPTAQAGVSLADMGRAVLRFSGDKAVRERAFPNQDLHSERRERRVQF